MRYIYYIAIILLGLSAVIGFELRRNTGAPANAAIIVNDKVITGEEFEKLYSLRQPRSQSRTEFINSLITKELLIQESKKAGIDKEESFRRSIQNFYEQSLTKLLIDKKLSSLKGTVSVAELDRCVSSWNKKFHVTIFRFEDAESAAKSDRKRGEEAVIYREDLCGDTGEKVLQLREGDMTGPIRSGEQYLVVRLDRIETGFPGAVTETEKEHIKKLLEDREKEKVLSDWISGLRKSAAIKILLTEKN